MELRSLGNSGLLVSRLALGTMTWGRDTDEHEAAGQLRSFLEAGGNLLDTAAKYGDGDSERVIGGFLGTLINRNDILLATTAGSSSRAPQGSEPSPLQRQRQRDNSRSSLVEELNGSLERLGVDHIDLWQIQGWDEGTPIEETLATMDYAVHSGKVRYIGLSNVSGWQLARAATMQNPLFGKAPISSIQTEYSLMNRVSEEEIAPAARELGVGLLAWSPLGRGVLTGKYRLGIPSDSRGATPHFAEFISPYLDPRGRSIVEAVCVAAEGLGYSPLEVALAWVRDNVEIASAIVGARTAAQLKGVLASEEIILPDQVRFALDDVSAALL